MSILIKGLTAKELLDVFEWARTGANNCMIGHGVVATELPDHGDLIDRDELKADLGITDWECEKCQWGVRCGCSRDDFSDACFFLENAEAVIPAERSEE